jgi:hypothetical protein
MQQFRLEDGGRRVSLFFLAIKLEKSRCIVVKDSSAIRVGDAACIHDVPDRSLTQGTGLSERCRVIFWRTCLTGRVCS